MSDTKVEEKEQEQEQLHTAENELDLITKAPNDYNSEILTGGSEFGLEDELVSNPVEESATELEIEHDAAKTVNADTEERKHDVEKPDEEQYDEEQYDEEKPDVEKPDEKKPDEEKPDEEQNGGATSIIEYKINYLVPDDEELVNNEKIKSAVKRYIDNYHSEGMKKYKQLFKTIYQKYSSKRYTIDNTDTEIIVSKSSNVAAYKQSKPEKRDIVFEISKPEYIFYNKENNLIHMKSNISNKRNELQLHYQSLVNKLDVLPEDKKDFERERKKFIELLERYYIFNLYHNQINSIVLEGKTNIIVQELQGFLKENTEKGYLLDGNLYTIDNSLIEKINTNNSNRLDQYNEFIVKFQGAKSLLDSGKSTDCKSTDGKSTDGKSVDKTDKKQKIIEVIKEYLKSNAENTKLNNEIKDAVRVQNTYVDYIISRVPSN